MKILEQALNKIKSINKKQRDFFVILVQGLIGVAIVTPSVKTRK